MATEAGTRPREDVLCPLITSQAITPHYFPKTGREVINPYVSAYLDFFPALYFPRENREVKTSMKSDTFFFPLLPPYGGGFLWEVIPSLGWRVEPLPNVCPYLGL